MQHKTKRMSRQDTQVASMLENDEHAGLGAPFAPSAMMSVACALSGCACPPDEESIREHEEATRVKNIQSVELGKHNMMTWCVMTAKGGPSG